MIKIGKLVRERQLFYMENGINKSMEEVKAEVMDVIEKMKKVSENIKVVIPPKKKKIDIKSIFPEKFRLSEE